MPKKERPRRSSKLMLNDPYTLVICLDRQGKAAGTLYLDDEKSYAYRNGESIYVNYEFANNQLTNRFITKPLYKSDAWIERIIIAGLGYVPIDATITAKGISQKLEIEQRSNGAIVVRKPAVKMNVDFALKLNAA